MKGTHHELSNPQNFCNSFVNKCLTDLYESKQNVDSFNIHFDKVITIFVYVLIVQVQCIIYIIALYPEEVGSRFLRDFITFLRDHGVASQQMVVCV
jgi:hypothetical protein